MWYVGKRLLSGLLTIGLISIVVFFVFQVIPGDPVLSRLGAEEIDQNPQLAARLYEAFNLDKPVLQRYGLWISGVIRGDMGTSFKYGGQQVNGLIADRLDATMVITGLSMILIVLVSLPLGQFIARHMRERSGVVYNMISQLGLAMPTFWVAIILMFVFSMNLGWVPTRANINLSRPVDTLRSVSLPVITLSIGNISAVIR